MHAFAIAVKRLVSHLLSSGHLSPKAKFKLNSSVGVVCASPILLGINMLMRSYLGAKFYKLGVLKERGFGIIR